MSKYTIGVDFGSLSGRAVLVDTADGRELSTATLDYPHAVIDRTLPGSGEALPADFALQDPRDYLLAAETVIPAVIRDAGVDARDVVGICIDFTCCTVLPVTGDGTPLCMTDAFANNKHAYAKMWKHHAAQPYADRINALAAERKETFLHDFGGKISSEWMFPKLMEVLDRAPEVYSAMQYMVEAGDWMTWMLTGKLTRSYYYAAYKSQYRKGIGYPSPDFLGALDERLRDAADTVLAGEIAMGGACVGHVTEEAARRFGLYPGTAVATAMPDGHVCSPALAQNEAGDMFGILGTSACYMLIDREYHDVPGICGIVPDGLAGGFYGYEAGLCCLGDHYAWVAANLFPPAYVKEAEERGIPAIRLLIEKAAAQKPGEHGLVALNWFNGNRNILTDASLSGMFLGMTLRTRPEDFMRAILEATAFATRLIIENFRDHGVPVKRFVACGGIARKDAFTMQLFSDILGIDIRVAGSAQVPALACAIYAAHAAGVYPTMRAASDAMNNVSDKVYRPNPENTAVYDALYREYLTLHDYFGRGGNDVMKRLRAISAESLLK